ncbi:MBL fold metallo-hydrolase [Bacillus dakarensis]|uniref:MBL fold metallo-hydrolase n=1 Tax=Robertmurraya dakarensis TaxID=1926278 RepID=UPI000982508E|nr:MBL fold metallo-hydrolase [Bacillus dakarensis]
MTEWKNGIAKFTIPTPFPVGDVNVYIVKGERLTLIDAGPKTEEAWHAFCDQLKQLNLAPSDIEQVILTHHHADHAGLLDYFSKDLEVYGHSINERWLSPSEAFTEKQHTFFKKLFIEFGIPAEYQKFIDVMKEDRRFTCDRSLTGFLAEGDIPVGLSDWKVVETPGHAQSHIGLYREKDGIYIGGDHLLAHITPNPIIEPPLPGETERPKSLLQYNRSLKKLLDIPIEFVYSGHGKEVYHVNDSIHMNLKQQHARAHKVKKWLESESLTVFEACQRLFPKAYKKELSLTISETVAQFDYLIDLKEINMTNEGGTIRYYA